MALKSYSIMNILEEVDADYEIIMSVNVELLCVITNAPWQENKETYIHSFLDDKLCDIDLTKSFKKKLVILYQEVIYVEILLAIHSWFYTKAANIENIIFISTQTLGLSEWYDSYLKLYGIKGFKIVDAPLTSEIYKDRWLTAIPELDKDQLNKKLKYLFSYYGGRYGSVERDFLAALLSTNTHGFVDYWNGFYTSSDEFENYAEQITNFLDRNLVDNLLEIHKKKKWGNTNQESEAIVSTGIIKNIDMQSACQVIRETSNLSPFSCITEKTIRGFLHLQFILPISGYKSVSYLEELGFKFAHDVIDYRYQLEPNLIKRLMMLVAELNRLSTTYTLDDWKQLIYENADMLCYNYNYFAEGNMLEKIKINIIKAIND
jgi:hypothetical protein